MVKYVDDCTIWKTCSVTGADSSLQDAATEAMEWSKKNKMALNSDKTNEMRVCFSRAPPNLGRISLEGRDVELMSETKVRGVVITDDLKWQAHIRAIVSQQLYLLTLLWRAGVDQSSLVGIHRHLPCEVCG